MKRLTIILAFFACLSGYGQTWTQQMLDSSSFQRRWNVEKQNWEFRLWKYPDSLLSNEFGTWNEVHGDSLDAIEITRSNIEDTLLLKQYYLKPDQPTIIEF